MNEVPEITMVEPETGGFLTAADDLAGALQSETKMKSLLDRVAQQARQHVPDVTTARGRDAIKSNAFKVTRSRTAIHQAGLDLTEEWRRLTRQVNALRESAKGQLETLEAEVRAPLDEWQQAEDARKSRLADMLATVNTAGSLTLEGAGSAELATEYERIKAVVIDDTWEDVADVARERRAASMQAVDRARRAAEAREEREREFQRMQEALAAEQAARAESEAKAAALRAEAEERAAAERAERAEQADQERREREAREREQAEAVRAAEERAAAAERAAEAAKAEAERLAKEAAEAEARARAEALRLAIEAEEKEAQTREDERRRIAEESAKEAQREADRARANEMAAVARRQVIDALAPLLPETSPEERADGEISYAEIVAVEIIAGRIPHVRFEPMEEWA